MAPNLTLGLQVPPQKVFGPSKPTPNTFSEGTTGGLGIGIFCYSLAWCLGHVWAPLWSGWSLEYEMVERSFRQNLTQTIPGRCAFVHIDGVFSLGSRGSQCKKRHMPPQTHMESEISSPLVQIRGGWVQAKQGPSNVLYVSASLMFLFLLAFGFSMSSASHVFDQVAPRPKSHRVRSRSRPVRAVFAVAAQDPGRRAERGAGGGPGIGRCGGTRTGGCCRERGEVAGEFVSR